MATRKDLPENPEADAYYQRQRQITIDYLRDKASRDERKTIIKEALHEWLEEKWAIAGRWSIAGIFAAAMAVLAYLYLTMHGWLPPHAGR